MATYAIGDVQGCWRSLKALLKHIRYRPGIDQLAFVGDLINRGPQSLDVLRFIVNQPNTVAVLGNHEIYACILAAGHLKRSDYQHTLDALLDAPDGPELVAWLRQLPLVNRLDEVGGVIVHAGIPVQWSIDEALSHSLAFQELMSSDQADAFLRVCFGDEPLQWSSDLSFHDLMRYRVNALTRMRYTDSQGRLDLQAKGASHPKPAVFRPWYAWRQREEEEIYFGHWASLQGRCDHPRIHALDTGCVYGKQLTAMRVDDRCFFSIPSAEA